MILAAKHTNPRVKGKDAANIAERHKQIIPIPEKTIANIIK